MGWPALKDCNILFLDTETGGLSAANRDIVEIACILTDPSGQTVLEEWEAKVLPVRAVEPEAAKINGYTAEKWAAAKAIELAPAMIKVLTMAHNTIMCCHNTPFDKSFIDAALAMHRQKWTGVYHSLCTMTMSMPLLRAGLVENIRLTTLTKYFGVPHENAHTAMDDTRGCRGVFLKLQEIYGPAVEAYAAARATQ
jgi:DNA polymerase III epsilon subunit-like protein